jgi:predicted RNA polymerase sigma factor
MPVAPLDPAAWLHRVGRNLAISRRAAARSRRAPCRLLDRGVAASPEDAVIARERDEMVFEALACWPATTAGSSCWQQGYRPEEIAGWSVAPTALRTRLCRARGRLRSHPALTGLTA